MNHLTGISGVKASILIKYNASIKELANKLSNELSLPKFWFKSDIDYPHEIIAMTECLGFELWLKNIEEFEGYNYQFSFETMLTKESIFETASIGNVSNWLASYLKVACDIKSKVVD